MALVFHDKRGRNRQRRRQECNMTTLNLIWLGALLYLAGHHQHITQSQAFPLIDYPTQAANSAPISNNNLGGLLPNGYNLAASNSMPANQLQQLPSNTQNQQQQQQQDNQQYSTGQQQQPPQDAYGSESAGGPQQPGQFSPPSGGRASRERDFLPNENQYSAPQPPPLERDPIFRFHGNALNSTAAKLVWSLRSGSVADLFELRYGLIPDNIDAFSVKLNGSARDLTVNSLQPGGMYEFRLQGYYGGSAASTWRPHVKLVQIPPMNEELSQQQAQIKQSLLDNGDIMPMGVKAEAKSNQSIQLSWTERERPANVQKSRRVNVIRYYVVSGPNVTSGDSLTQSSGGQQANSSLAPQQPPPPPPRYSYVNITADSARGEMLENRVTISKLRPATEYAFAVRTAYYSPDGKKLYTSSGFSMDTHARTHDLEPSSVRNFTVTQLPLSGQTEQVASESGKPVMPTVELTWAPPESPNGLIRAYWILFTTDLGTPDDKWSLIQINDTTSNFWQVGNLKPGLSYYFKMRALNQRGPGPDSQTRVFTTPPAQKLVGLGGSGGGGGPSGTLAGGPPPIPANNILMLIVICLVAILFVLFLVVSRLFCRTRSSAKRVNRKSSNNHLQVAGNGGGGDFSGAGGVPKLNGFGPSGNSSSTVTARMGTLARRARPTDASGNNKQQQQAGGGDYWISAMEQQQAIAAQAAAAADVKSQISSEKSNSDINMAAMVSIQRDSPQQFTTQTTQLAPMLAGPAEYRFAAAVAAAEQQQQQQQLIMQQMHQQQQQGHYHTGHHALGYVDQMDGATASALMTLSKRQQQQLLKYGQMQPFGAINGGQTGGGGVQAPSPHQQPPPPPPLNIEQQQQQQQSVYGTHGGHLNSTRSLRIHRPPLSYDPVSGSFVQQQNQQQEHSMTQRQSPPNYNSHLNSMLNGVHHQLASYNQQNNTPTSGSNTLQFHPSHHQHHTGTLTSRRSTNTLRSFGGGGGGVYGQLGSFAVQPPVAGNQQQQQAAGGGLLQNHQAVINQLNQPTALPLKHVSAVRPQIMSSLEDQIEMELAEKQAEQQQQRQGPPVSMQQHGPGAEQHSQQQQQQQQT